MGDGVLGFSVCALTTKARRPSAGAGRDRAPKRPAGKATAPTMELMAMAVAIYRREVYEGRRKKLRKLLLAVCVVEWSVADVFVVSLWAQFIGFCAPGREELGGGHVASISGP